MANMKASAASDLDVKQIADEMNHDNLRYAEAQIEQEKAYRHETDAVIEMMKQAQAAKKHAASDDTDAFVKIIARVPPRAVTEIVQAVETQQDQKIVSPKMKLYWAGFVSGVCMCLAIAAAVGIMVIA